VRAVGGTGELTDAETQFVETEVTKLNLKSVIARVRKSTGAHQVLGFVLNDGTPLRSVEVKVDEGPWQRATLDPANTQYSWKVFTYRWESATPGEHTFVSRATDVNGAVQPTAAELSRKKTFLALGLSGVDAGSNLRTKVSCSRGLTVRQQESRAERAHQLTREFCRFLALSIWGWIPEAPRQVLRQKPARIVGRGPT
jgi:hypothetical protein